jgi:hypothetical protein
VKRLVRQIQPPTERIPATFLLGETLAIGGRRMFGIFGVIFVLVPRRVAVLYYWTLLLLVVLMLAVAIGRQYGWWIPGAALAPFPLYVLACWFLSVGYPYLRGRRNRDQGIPCVQCSRVAFPLEGSRTRYRCWNCGGRFDGPEHF